MRLRPYFRWSYAPPFSLLFTGAIPSLLRVLDMFGRVQSAMNLPVWISHPLFGIIFMAGGFIWLMYLSKQPNTEAKNILGPDGLPYKQPKHPSVVIAGAAIFLAIVVAIPLSFYLSRSAFIEGSLTLLQWGVVGKNTAYVIVDASEFMPAAHEHRLMVIARPRDYTIEAMADTDIDKSTLFEITKSPKRLDLIVNKQLMGRMIPYGYLQLWVLVVPHTIKLDQVQTIGDAIKMGGQIAANPSILVHPGYEIRPN